jgi:hypothetical protein
MGAAIVMRGVVIVYSKSSYFFTCKNFNGSKSNKDIKAKITNGNTLLPIFSQQ